MLVAVLRTHLFLRVRGRIWVLSEGAPDFSEDEVDECRQRCLSAASLPFSSISTEAFSVKDDGNHTLCACSSGDCTTRVVPNDQFYMDTFKSYSVKGASHGVDQLLVIAWTSLPSALTFLRLLPSLSLRARVLLRCYWIHRRRYCVQWRWWWRRRP